MERDQVQDFATLLQNGRRDDIKEICFLLRRDDALDDGWRERERKREREGIKSQQKYFKNIKKGIPNLPM